jgi:hypothetical protein
MQAAGEAMVVQSAGSYVNSASFCHVLARYSDYLGQNAKKNYKLGILGSLGTVMLAVQSAVVVPAPGKLRGQVDKVHGGFKVEGWAQDLSNPDFPVSLELLHDGVVLGEVLACDYRPDLQKAGIGRGYHAFTFVSPIRLTPEIQAGLSVRRKSDGAPLGVNPEIRKLAGLPVQGPSSANVPAAPSGGATVPQLRLVGGLA